MNRKVIAQNITNLTDARYFAAWGVDYLSFNTRSDKPYYITNEAIKEIKDWVEGPACLLETQSLETDDLADGYILSNIYSSLPLVKESFFRVSFDDVTLGLPGGKYISKIEAQQLDKLKKLSSDHFLGVDLFFDISNLDFKHLNELENFGIVIQGGEEEKIGVKAFDDLDVLYDLLLG